MSVMSDLLNGVLAIDAKAEVIEYQGRWYSWGELAETIGAIRAGLASVGVAPDSRIGVFVRNRPAALAAILTAVADDCCMVSINPLMPADKLLRDLETLKLPVVILEEGDLATPGVAEMLKDDGTAVIETVGVLGGARVANGFETFAADKVRALEAGVIIEMLTSGTTGTPKRIPLKREAFETSFVAAFAYEKDRNPGDPPKLRSGIQLLTNPLSHIGGLWGALSAVLGGRKSCLIEKFSVETWRDAVARHRPKVASAVPAALRMILDADIPKEDLASLVAIRTGAAPLDPAITAEFFERYNIPVLQNYGATEFSGAVAGWTLKDFLAFYKEKGESVGRFQPGVKGRIIDPDTGEELTPGTEGVLEMKARQFGNGDQWLRTTDRAVIDADGFLFIRGRADNAIIRGGFKVHPDDVVAALEKHPAVREAVVVGVDDRRLGAVPVAAIILKAGAAQPSDGELADFAKEKLLPYQVPVRFLFVDEVPRTPSMKPALPAVRELFATGEAA
jgi:acyl-CoA synthetase (AMP-forming)/AMP-acid ligase II